MMESLRSVARFLNEFAVILDHLYSVATTSSCACENQEKAGTLGPLPYLRSELASGQPQTNPHRDRRIVAKDEETQCSKN